ncbi:hypothetical protein F66182_15103 [Fusarium sp. NRRL 66182]|nr:hypothetical protein F66182_15103 [Fusarium sp. NRRL 66182]
MSLLDERVFGISDNLSDDERSFVSRVSSTPEFGFTIGSTKSVLQCISSITIAGRKMKTEHSQQAADVLRGGLLSTIMSCLEKCKEEITYNNFQDSEIGSFDDHTDQSQILANHQKQAFISATYIYLYRVLFDLPPHSVRQYVSEVLLRISAFHSASHGNLSIWPAFIAAVEAYTPEDMALARGWLRRTTMFGIGSRLYVRILVEEVWKRRDETATKLGIDKGLIPIDWRVIMKELDMDILLI